VAGTLTLGADSSTLGGTNTAHYLAYQPASSFPGSGTVSCGPAQATQATAITGVPVLLSVVDSDATVAFTADGAQVSVAWQLQGDGRTVTESWNTTVPFPASSSFTGLFFGNGRGAAITLGDGGSGQYRVHLGYRAQDDDGVRYVGVTSFLCG